MGWLGWGMCAIFSCLPEFCKCSNSSTSPWMALPISNDERILVWHSRDMDQFVGRIRSLRSSMEYNVHGFMNVHGGFFQDCFLKCDDRFCLTREMCCGESADTNCFDGVYFTKSMCCHNVPSGNTDSIHHPFEVLTRQYGMLGLEQQQQRITARRLEHLATLALPIAGRRILELGARTGDLTNYFTDRGCHVTVVEPRYENLLLLRSRLALGHLFPRPDKVKILSLDLDKQMPIGHWDVAVCYGLLYHLRWPRQFLRRIASRINDFLVLETKTHDGRTSVWLDESGDASAQGLADSVEVLSRAKIFTVLKSVFPYVYVPSTQPAHEQFPLDWSRVRAGGLSRAVFIASRRKLNSSVGLLSRLPRRQKRAC